MYTILVRQDDTLIATNKENIFHRSSLIRKLRFLVDPIYIDGYEEMDMRTYMCTLEYKTPISQRYTPVILQPSKELYKDKLEYMIPVDTAITAEPGQVEMQLKFVKLEMKDGTYLERVRKTESINIDIQSTNQWSDYIADSELDNIAQILLSIQAQNEQSKVYADQIAALASYNSMTKADDISYDKEKDELQLTALGKPIGQKIALEARCDEEGVPVIDLGGSINPNPDDPEDNEIDNVVEIYSVKQENNEFNNVIEI